MTKRLARLRPARLAGSGTALLRRSSVLLDRRARAAKAVREAGMTTAEYAIGTLAACGFAALLVTILRGSIVQGLLLGIIKRALALGG
jgi:Protein of unknown function (DUF4244)